MRSYPLLRRRLSNEHIMTALFAVLILYQIPQWMQNPAEIPAFFVILATALFIDAGAGFLFYKRPVCSVSSAVTAGVLSVMTPGIPLWGRLVGIVAALVAGKHIWGGTGKNVMNPAILGTLLVYIIFRMDQMPIEPSMLYLPALLLSLPFILYRPYASLGLIAGTALVVFTGNTAIGMTLLVNSIFLATIVITDPVTTTPFKLPGVAGGLAIGLGMLWVEPPLLSFILCILIFNLVSYLIDDLYSSPAKWFNYSAPSLKRTVKRMDCSLPALDLTCSSTQGSDEENMKDCPDKIGGLSAGMKDPVKVLDELTPDEILARIRQNEVYGCGGAAFPTVEKLRSLMASDKPKKYLIINGVECDPGLIHDHWLLRSRTEEIHMGIRAVCKCTGIEDVTVAVKKAEGLSFPDGIRLFSVKDYYPAGFEKILIKNILKMDVPSGSIPSSSGILVLNVQTLILIYEAVFGNKKADQKYITVADLRTGEARVVKAKLGDSITGVLESVYPGRQPVFTGGGIMQATMADEMDVIKKSTNFIAASDMPKYKESPFCSNCNACMNSCPQGLRVQKIVNLVENEKLEEAAQLGSAKCVRCGLCSYVCPAGRNLSARVEEAKNVMIS